MNGKANLTENYRKFSAKRNKKISQYPKQIFHLTAEKGFWKDNNLNILEKV